jgi:hypothetical protein
MGKYVSAFSRKDMAAIEKIVKENFADDFVDVDVRGMKRTRQQWLEQMRMQVQMTKSVQKCLLKVGSVKVSGAGATSLETMDLVATIPNMADPKKTSKLEVKASWVGTYAKRNGKWWCVKSVGKTEVVKIDGKPLNPAGG